MTGLLLRSLIEVTILSTIMEDQMEKKMENEMETGGIWRFKELNLSYYIGETP